MSFTIKDFLTGLSKTIHSTAFGGEDVPYHIVASPIDGSPLFRDSMFDAFGRMRVSLPTAIADIQNQYWIHPRFWDSGLSVGAGNASLGVGSTTLSTGSGTIGDACILQSRRYHRYRPGRSHVFVGSFNAGAAVASVRKRVGYFDAENGLFLEQNSTTDVAMVVRSKVSGGVVDTRVIQPNWNVDTFGAGALNPSGITLDFSKAQILVIDFQWLGVGTVHFGFFINGRLWPAHSQHHANNIAVPYMVSANLPIRFSIENLAGIGGANTMIIICAAVFSEGTESIVPLEQFAMGNGATLISTTTRRPLFSIRPRATFNTVNFRGLLRPKSWQPFVQSSDAFFELVLGGTLATPSWVNVDTNNSGADYDISSTTITGGIVIDSAYQGASQNGIDRVIDYDEALCLNADLSQTARNLSICATRFSGATNCGGLIRWFEDK